MALRQYIENSGGDHLNYHNFEEKKKKRGDVCLSALLETVEEMPELPHFCKRQGGDASVSAFL
jgi:hypothetical protein